MSDKYKTYAEHIWLKESMGYISISNEENLSEASIYIDQTSIRELPKDYEYIKISSGRHTL